MLHVWWEESLYNFYKLFFSLSERIGFKKKPSNFYCVYMFLTYYVLEKIFVLTHTVEILFVQSGKCFVMCYNLPYSCPLPRIVSREVRR